MHFTKLLISGTVVAASTLLVSSFVSSTSGIRAVAVGDSPTLFAQA